MPLFRSTCLTLLVCLAARHVVAHPLLEPSVPSSEVTGLSVHVDLDQSTGQTTSRINRRNGGNPKLHGSSGKYSVPEETVALWDKHHVCGPLAYWQPNAETMAESKAKEFVVDWMTHNSGANLPADCKATGFTLMQCYMSTWTGNFDFRCPIDHLQRCQAPTPRGIADWISSQHPEWPTDRVLDTTRKVFYGYKTFEIAIADLKTDWDTLHAAEVNVATEAHELIGSFTQGYSKTRDANCQAAKTAAQLAVDIALQAGVVGANTAQFSGPLKALSDAVQQANKAIGEASDDKKKKEVTQAYIRIAQQENLVKQSIFYAQAGVGMGRKAQQISDGLRDAHYAAKAGEEAQPPRLEYPSIRGHGVCGILFNVIEDNLVAQTDNMITFINSHMLAIRYTIEQLFNSIFIKEQEDLGDTTILGIMNFDGWTGRTRRTYENLELKIRGVVRAALISELLAASRQYIKCEERDDAKAVCMEARNRPEGALGIFCHEKYPRLRCQAGSWTKKKMLNHETELPALHGKDSFAAHGMVAADVFLNSIDRYYSMGTDSYSSRGLYSEGKIASSHQVGHLPISISKIKTVSTDDWRRGFPFSTGGWSSNGTAIFMSRLHINLAAEKELVHKDLVNHLELIPEPANRFLLLCHLGVQWPTGSTASVVFDTHGPSPACSPVEAEIGDKDELEGNYRFCKMKLVHEAVFKLEHSHFTPLLGKNKPHKRLCEKWLAENSIEIQRRFGSQ